MFGRPSTGREATLLDVREGLKPFVGEIELPDLDEDRERFRRLVELAANR